MQGIHALVEWKDGCSQDAQASQAQHTRPRSPTGPSVSQCNAEAQATQSVGLRRVPLMSTLRKLALDALGTTVAISGQVLGLLLVAAAYIAAGLYALASDTWGR